MNRNLSVYLDLLRLLAAIGVFLGHVRHMILPGMPILIGAQAAQCVAVFFVLSGFVISFVTDGKETDWRTYAGARAARMYSVVLLAVAVTLVADAVGRSLDPAFYAAADFYNPATSPLDVARYLTFTNELWFGSALVGSDQPYWSLGYEVPYYLLFGLAFFLRGPARIAALAVAALAIGPRVLLYWPLWLMGVAAYRIVRRPLAPSRSTLLLGVGLFGFSGLLYAIVRFGPLRQADNIFEFRGWGAFARTWVHFHLVGLAVTLNILGFRLIALGAWHWPEPLAAAIRWAAGGSFTLYLMHLPILAAIVAAGPAMRTTGGGMLTILAVIAIVLVLAELGERRKKAFVAVWARLGGRALARPAATGQGPQA